MSFIFDKQLMTEFDIIAGQHITVSGDPVKILQVLDEVHPCSQVVFKWAQLDVSGHVIAWHVSTARLDGAAQLGSGHRLMTYAVDIVLQPSTLGIW